MTDTTRDICNVDTKYTTGKSQLHYACYIHVDSPIKSFYLFKKNRIKIRWIVLKIHRDRQRETTIHYWSEIFLKSDINQFFYQTELNQSENVNLEPQK
jgi:hypothetical protein